MSIHPSLANTNVFFERQGTRYLTPCLVLVQGRVQASQTKRTLQHGEAFYEFLLRRRWSHSASSYRNFSERMAASAIKTDAPTGFAPREATDIYLEYTDYLDRDTDQKETETCDYIRPSSQSREVELIVWCNGRSHELTQAS